MTIGTYYKYYNSISNYLQLFNYLQTFYNFSQIFTTLYNLSVLNYKLCSSCQSLKQSLVAWKLQQTVACHCESISYSHEEHFWAVCCQWLAGSPPGCCELSHRPRCPSGGGLVMGWCRNCPHTTCSLFLTFSHPPAPAPIHS